MVGRGQERRGVVVLLGVKKIGITDLTLRDGHQSLIATRMRLEDILPIAEAMDEVGFHSLEVWGGATFDTCIRFLDEDPWERLRELKKRFKKTPLQMLLRGQNVVGYRHYPDDVVREFVKRAALNGIDIFRIFDALNDIRNMEVAVDAVKKEGAHAQLAISYTVSPVHTLEKYLEMVKDMVELGADSICIKDMSGLLSPKVAYELVRAIKEKYNIPVQVHSHYTSGMASMALLKAVEAGADIIDTAMSPFAMGTSHPATETMVYALNEMGYDTGIELNSLIDISEHFKRVRELHKDKLADLTVDVNVLVYQIPGGMYSNFISQLKEQRALDKLRAVLEEVPRVRKELGYPPLVTPTSQLVGTQATLNVLLGERYKIIPKEVRDYIKGFYGRPPAPIDPEVKKKAIGDEEPISCRPGDLLEPMLDKCKRELGVLAVEPEDVLTYALFPQIALDFLRKKYARKFKIDLGFERPIDEYAYPV